jgi:hypothetical protein
MLRPYIKWFQDTLNDGIVQYTGRVILDKSAMTAVYMLFVPPRTRIPSCLPVRVAEPLWRPSRDEDLMGQYICADDLTGCRFRNVLDQKSIIHRGKAVRHYRLQGQNQAALWSDKRANRLWVIKDCSFQQWWRMRDTNQADTGRSVRQSKAITKSTICSRISMGSSTVEQESCDIPVELFTSRRARTRWQIGFSICPEIP